MGVFLVVDGVLFFFSSSSPSFSGMARRDGETNDEGEEEAESERGSFGGWIEDVAVGEAKGKRVAVAGAEMVEPVGRKVLPNVFCDGSDDNEDEKESESVEPPTFPFRSSAFAWAAFARSRGPSAAPTFPLVVMGRGNEEAETERFAGRWCVGRCREEDK